MSEDDEYGVCATCKNREIECENCVRCFPCCGCGDDLIVCSYCDEGVPEDQVCSGCGVCEYCEDFCDLHTDENLCWACCGCEKCELCNSCKGVKYGACAGCGLGWSCCLLDTYKCEECGMCTGCCGCENCEF